MGRRDARRSTCPVAHAGGSHAIPIPSRRGICAAHSVPAASSRSAPQMARLGRDRIRVEPQASARGHAAPGCSSQHMSGRSRSRFPCNTRPPIGAASVPRIRCPQHRAIRATDGAAREGENSSGTPSVSAGTCGAGMLVAAHVRSLTLAVPMQYPPPHRRGICAAHSVPAASSRSAPQMARLGGERIRVEPQASARGHAARGDVHAPGTHKGMPLQRLNV